MPVVAVAPSRPMYIHHLTSTHATYVALLHTGILGTYRGSSHLCSLRCDVSCLSSSHHTHSYWEQGGSTGLCRKDAAPPAVVVVVAEEEEEEEEEEVHFGLKRLERVVAPTLAHAAGEQW